MLSFSSKAVSSGYLVLFLALCLSQGGRDPLGASGYFIFSVLAALFVFKGREDLEKTPLDRPLLVFLAVSLFSAVHALISRGAGVAQIAVLLAHGLNFYTLSKTTPDEKSNPLWFGLMGVSGFLGSAVCLQYAAGLPKPVFFPNANLLAGFIACGIAAGIAKAVLDDTLTFRSRMLWSLPAAAGIAAEFFLLSRGSLAALAAALLVLLFLNFKKFLVPVLSFAALGLCLVLLFPENLQRISLKTLSLMDNTRILIWQAALQAWGDRPFWGWGLGGFEDAFKIYRLPNPQDIGQYQKLTAFAHNEYLHFAVEMGGVGLAAFLWLTYGIFRSGLKNLSGAAWPKGAALAVMTVILVHAFFDFNLHLPVIGFLFVFSAGILVRVKEAFPSRFPDEKTFGKARKAFAAFAVLGSAAALFYAASSAAARTEKAHAFAHIFNPFDPEAAARRASLAAKPEEKEKILRKSLVFNRKNDVLQAELARVYFGEKRFKDSAKAYGTALEQNPKNAFYLAELGDVFIQTGQIPEARSLYEQAVRTEPLYSFAHYRLGEILLALGDPVSARRAFENVLKIREAGLVPDSDYSKRLLDFDASLARKRIETLGSRPVP